MDKVTLVCDNPFYRPVHRGMFDFRSLSFLPSFEFGLNDRIKFKIDLEDQNKVDNYSYLSLSNSIARNKLEYKSNT